MPPPRLPRHLRPCHPPGTAKQVRCAHKPARVKFSTAGDESPRRPNAYVKEGGSSKSRDTADRTTGTAAGTSSWWSAAMGSVASLVFKTAPTASGAHADIPATSTSGAVEENQDTPGGGVHALSPGLIRKTSKGPERRLKQQERFAARLQRIQEERLEQGGRQDTAGGEGSSPLPVKTLDPEEPRRVAARLQQTTKETAEKEGNSAVPIRRLVTNVDTRRVRQLQCTRAEEERQPPATSSDNVQIPGTPSTASTFQRQDSAMGREPVPIQTESITTIQQQLDQLFEHVRRLQASLEGKQAAEQPASASAAAKKTSTTESGISKNTEQQLGSGTRPLCRKVLDPEPFLPIREPVAAAPRKSRASREVTKINTRNETRATESRAYAHVYREARSAYKSSFKQLAETAKVLGELPPRAVAPLASTILQRFRDLALEKETKFDREVIYQAETYNHVLKSLAEGLAQIPIADDAPPHFINSGTTATPRPTDKSGNMVFAVRLGWSLHACAKGYNMSTKTLVDVANALENMRATTISPILIHVRNRLRGIAEHAKLERDSGVLSILGHYKHWKMLYAEAKYSPNVIRQPSVLLRLAVADVSSRSNRISKELRSLGKQISLISPSSPRAHIAKKAIKQAKSRAPNTRHQGVETSRSAKTHSQVRVRVAGAANVNGSTQIYMAENRSDGQASERAADATTMGTDSLELYVADKKNDGQRLTRQIHTQSRSMKSSGHLKINTEDSDQGTTEVKDSKEQTLQKPSPDASIPIATAANIPPKPTPRNDEPSEQSLLEELFPEATSTPQPPYSDKRVQYPKLDPPDSTPIIRRELVDAPRTPKEQVVDSFQRKGEQIIVLQLTNCSIELTEADFRRLIPKGKHIEAWRRDGDFYKIIPGRDPLSLERMPFYYIFFKDTESALAYQKNVSRLHKLSALHQPANIFSAIPPPKGFLEDGEDITAAIQSYNLLPTHHPMSLNWLMQPYNPALRALIERGGYQPIAPSLSSDGSRIWKVLLHIEGYEPTPSDLFKILSKDAYKQGMRLPLRNESHSSIHRLRDVINLKTSMKPISSASPRAYGSFEHNKTTANETTYADPAIQSMLEGAEEDNANALNQLVMNRVYNRWVLDFETEDEARRWTLSWHRRVLPELSHGKGGWREGEEIRVCNTEVLW